MNNATICRLFAMVLVLCAGSQSSILAEAQHLDDGPYAHVKVLTVVFDATGVEKALLMPDMEHMSDLNMPVWIEGAEGRNLGAAFQTALLLDSSITLCVQGGKLVSVAVGDYSLPPDFCPEIKKAKTEG